MASPLAPITHLLDTQAWIWFVAGNPRARRLHTELPPGARLGISAITVWESAMLEAKGRVVFQPDLEFQVRELAANSSYELIPLLPQIAIASARLEALHGDPADRIVVATAMHIDATLVTSDRKIIDWAAAAPGRLSVLAI